MLLNGEESFKSYVTEEIDSINSSLSFELKNYLSELLYFYLFSERLFDHKTTSGISCESLLVNLYKKTSKADTQEKIYIFKKMGDLSLYISGFFRLAVEQRIVHISYYEDMGQSAYNYLATYYKERDNVFSSLSKEFKTLSEVLFYIQQKSEDKSNKNYLNICSKTGISLKTD